jgi:starch synthase
MAPIWHFPGATRLGYWNEQWEYLNAWSFGVYAARNLPECDVYVGLSGSALRAGRKAKSRGAAYVCDRGSSHIRVQKQILRDEHKRWGLPFAGFDPRITNAEESEYAEADCITLPSQFTYRSFLSQGLPSEKLRLLNYGVDLSRFEPAGVPAEGKFDVLFVGGMSLRKGVQYLTDAFQRINHPAKTLSFVGAPSFELIAFLRQRKLWPDDARVLGHVPQSQLKTVMSRSHVMVLPSVEEGLALVQAQAMACGCPVIGTPNSGAEDLYSDGQEGYIVPIRDADALAERLQHLADHPEQRAEMSEKSPGQSPKLRRLAELRRQGHVDLWRLGRRGFQPWSLRTPVKWAVQKARRVVRGGLLKMLSRLFRERRGARG